MKGFNSKDIHITLPITRAQAKAASEPNVVGKTYGENLSDSNRKLSDSSVHINVDKDKMFTMLTGLDEERKKFVEWFNFSLLLDKFEWSNRSALTIPALIDDKRVMAVVDSGCSGVFISRGCYERLDLEADDEIEMMLTSAINTL